MELSKAPHQKETNKKKQAGKTQILKLRKAYSATQIKTKAEVWKEPQLLLAKDFLKFSILFNRVKKDKMKQNNQAKYNEAF